MTSVPQLASDIAFGGANEPLPDWRAEEEDVDNPELADEPDDHSGILTQLFGYDPSWWLDSKRLATEPAKATEEEPDESPSGGHALARFYADHWNLLEQSGADIGDDEIAHAADELADGGWAIAKTPHGWRAVPVTDGEATDSGMVRMSTDHAPAGGVSLKGKHYSGGQFIPSAVIDSLPAEDKQRLAFAKQQAKTKLKERTAHKVPELAGRLKEYAGEALSPSEQRSAKSSFAQLHRHHGDLTLHRITDLADQLEGALTKVPADEVGLRGQLRRRLAALHGMMAEAEGKGVKPPALVQPSAERRTVAPETRDTSAYMADLDRRMQGVDQPSPEDRRDPTAMEAATGIEREPGVGKPSEAERMGIHQPAVSTAAVQKPQAVPAVEVQPDHVEAALAGLRKRFGAGAVTDLSDPAAREKAAAELKAKAASAPKWAGPQNPPDMEYPGGGKIRPQPTGKVDDHPTGGVELDVTPKPELEMDLTPEKEPDVFDLSDVPRPDHLDHHARALAHVESGEPLPPLLARAFPQHATRATERAASTKAKVDRLTSLKAAAEQPGANHQRLHVDLAGVMGGMDQAQAISAAKQFGAAGVKSKQEAVDAIKRKVFEQRLAREFIQS